MLWRQCKYSERMRSTGYLHGIQIVETLRFVFSNYAFLPEKIGAEKVCIYFYGNAALFILSYLSPKVIPICGHGKVAVDSLLLSDLSLGKVSTTRKCQNAVSPRCENQVTSELRNGKVYFCYARFGNNQLSNPN